MTNDNLDKLLKQLKVNNEKKKSIDFILKNSGISNEISFIILRIMDDFIFNFINENN